MRTVEITDKDFVRLQALAQPLIDTPATVIARLLDKHGAAGGVADDTDDKSRVNQPKPAAMRIYSFQDAPSMAHAKLMDARLGDEGLEDKMAWNALHRRALSMVMEKVNLVQELRKISGANIKPGKYTVHGYRYVEKHDFSYQEGSAGMSLEMVRRCVEYLNITGFVEVEWRRKDGAAHPGERARVNLP